MERVETEWGRARADNRPEAPINSSKPELPPTSSAKVQSRTYDLEDRTFEFARDVRAFVKNLPRTLANIEDARQLINASGSVGSNYIEANEALSKKDFVMRVKICRKEAKESHYWLRLIHTTGKPELETRRESLIQEAVELTSIFGAIFRKPENSK
jgi:four helix bundle protein